MLEHLCSLQKDHPFLLDVIDIDENLELQPLFNDLVPVLKHRETEICRYFMDQASLLQHIKLYS